MTPYTDVIVCSLESWDAVWRRNQHFVTRLLRANPALRVLFVEPPTDPVHELIHRHRASLSGGLRGVDDVGDGRLWTYQQAKPLPRRVGRVVDAALTGGVRRAARRIAMRDPVLWINDPSRAPLLAATGLPALYDITDDWLLANRGPRELARLQNWEDRLLDSCRAVVVCSPSLAISKGRFRPVELISNGVDLERYTLQRERPADLPAGRVALYVGTLHEDRLDVDLCLRTAARLADVGSLVFVGPNALDPVTNSRRLSEAPGVRILGPRLHTDVSAYLQHADVLVVPHVVDEFTESLDPIKLYEYLAVGRPVVATPVAGFRDAEPPIRVAQGDLFVEQVRDLLLADEPTATPPPNLPTWDAQAEHFGKVLFSLR